MEIFAGFVEHVDVQAGKVIDELEREGVRDNTLIFYIFGDNGSSAEGQNGSISELLAQNQIPNTVAQQIEALDKIGGLDALGSSKTDSMYHAGWAWAGDTPFQHTKLIASHFGGTRNPMAISWPRRITPDQDATCPVPSRERHRADHLRGRRHQSAEGRRRFRAGPDRRHQPGLHVRRREGRGPEEYAILRQQRQPRPLPRRLVRLDLRAAHALADGEPRASQRGIRARTSGSFTTCRRTSPRPTISR